MNGKLKSSRKIFAPFFPSPQSFDTVTLDDNYSHVEDGYKRQTPPNDYQPLSLLLSSTTTLYPTPSYEVISDSNTKPWKLSSPTVRICCGNISEDPSMEEGRLVRIYEGEKNGEEKQPGYHCYPSLVRLHITESLLPFSASFQGEEILEKMLAVDVNHIPSPRKV